MNNFVSADFSGNGGTTTHIAWPTEEPEVVTHTDHSAAPVHHRLTDADPFAMSSVPVPTSTDPQPDA